MCGHGGYGFSVAASRAGRRVEEAPLRAMGAALVHRGPDDEGLWIDARAAQVGALFRRLSIIDLAGGHQPIPNEAGDLWVLGNGEIYNHVALRAELEAAGHRFRTHSDIETIVHLYEEHGVGFAERLIGMFGVAVIDQRGAVPQVVLARDSLGIKPMYYSVGPDGFAWASEPKGILALEEAGPVAAVHAREMRPEALLEYLMRGFIGDKESAWAGMHRLRPGSTLVWRADATPVETRATETRYFHMPLELRDPASEDEVCEWVDRVVSDRLMAEVPLGAFLSGGIDSSAVVTSMKGQLTSGKPLIACSVGFNEKSHNELDIAIDTARSLGAEHFTEILEADPQLATDVLPWFFDEPLADPSTVPTYLVSKMAREHVTVALSGDGGDETFAGYRRYLHDHAENQLRRAIGPVGRKLAGWLGAAWPKLDRAPRIFRGKRFLTNVAQDPALAYFQSVSILDRSEALALLAPDVRQRVSAADPFHEFAAHYNAPQVNCSVYRAQYADIHTYLTDQILAKVDRASMAVSLEARVPLLDHRFVQRFANLPLEQKLSGGRGKHLLRESQRKRLSSAVLDGAKRGFDTPLDAWLRGPLRGAVEQAVQALPATWFDKPYLAQLLAEHRAGKRNHGRVLWSLLVLERWAARHGVRGLAA